MRYIQDIEDQSSLRALIAQDLKELGIKPPKYKKLKCRDDTLPLVSILVLLWHISFI